MKKRVLAPVMLSLLASCYTVPEATDFSLELNRDYKQVADCAWLSFRTKADWSRDNLDSMNRVEFSFGNTSSTAGRIDIVGVGAGKTRILSHMPRAVWGAEFWAKKHKPIFEACA